MSCFKRIIKQSRQRIFAEGTAVEAGMIPDEVVVDAGQRRVRQPEPAVDRTVDLSVNETGEWEPVLELVEDKNDKEASKEYKEVCRDDMERTVESPGVMSDEYSADVQTGRLDCAKSESNAIPGFGGTGNVLVETKENERGMSELKASEETGFYKGSRSDPAADSFSRETEIQTRNPQGAALPNNTPDAATDEVGSQRDGSFCDEESEQPRTVTRETDAVGISRMDPDELLFGRSSEDAGNGLVERPIPAERTLDEVLPVIEFDPSETRAHDPALQVPQAVRADEASPFVPDRPMAMQGRPESERSVRIDRVRVRVVAPKPKKVRRPVGRSPSVSASHGGFSESRTFMGDA